MKKQINFIKAEFNNAKIEDLTNLIKLYSDDERAGVKKLIDKAKKFLFDHDNELQRLNSILKFENIAYQNGNLYIAGFDEVGRGALAGPVVTASVILPKGLTIFGINDSKKLSIKKREELFDEINKKALEVVINMEDNQVIDKINILEATKLSMQKNLNQFKQKPDFLIIDAINFDNSIQSISIPKADENSQSVAAASIIAKVTRDRYMDQMSKLYPQYNFEKNKGYGTKQHIEALVKYGSCSIHRKSFIKNFNL